MSEERILYRLSWFHRNPRYEVVWFFISLFVVSFGLGLIL